MKIIKFDGLNKTTQKKQTKTGLFYIAMHRKKSKVFNSAFRKKYLFNIPNQDLIYEFIQVVPQRQQKCPSQSVKSDRDTSS